MIRLTNAIESIQRYALISILLTAMSMNVQGQIPAIDILPQYCDTTISDFNNNLGWETVTNQQAIKLRFINASTNDTSYGDQGVSGATKELWYFSGLTEGNLKFEQTYIISAAAMVGGEWGPFGDTCRFHTGTPSIDFDGLSNNDTIDDMDYSVDWTTVGGQQGVQILFLDTIANEDEFGAHISSGPAALHYFSASHEGKVDFGRRYQLAIRPIVNDSFGNFSDTISVYVAQQYLQIDTSFYDKDYDGFDDYIGWNSLPAQEGVEIQFVDLGTIDSSYVGDTTLGNWLFQGDSTLLSNFSGAAEGNLQLGHTYRISARAYINGNWGAFGDTCRIHIESPSINIRSEFHDTTYYDFSQDIGWTIASGQTGVEIKFENLDSGLTTYGQVYVTSGQQPMSLFSGTAEGNLIFGNTYRISARPYLNGQWGTFGDTCHIHIGYPTSRLDSAYCGSSYSDWDKFIKWEKPGGQQGIELEFVDQETNDTTFGQWYGTADNTIIGYFAGVDEGDLAYATDYMVRARPWINNQWGAFSDSCLIHITVPEITLDTASCGKTFDRWDEKIVWECVDGHVETELAFRDTLTDSLTTGTFLGNDHDANLDEFALSNEANLQFNTSYWVYARARVKSIWGEFGDSCLITLVPTPTNIDTQYCNKTYTDFQDEISWEAVGGRQGVRLKFYDPIADTTTYGEYSNGTDTDAPLDEFSGVNEGNLQFGTDYYVQAQPIVNGQYGAFGDTCLMSIGWPTTDFLPQSCDTSTDHMDQKIYWEAVGGRQGAQVEFVDLTGGAIDTTYGEYIGNKNYRDLDQIGGPAGGDLHLNTLYSMRVRPKVNNQWGQFGAACSLQITEPVISVDAQYDSTHYTSFAQPIAWTAAAMRTDSRLQFVDLSTTDTTAGTRGSNSSSGNLDEFSGPAEANLQLGGIYEVRAAVLINGDWTQYGPPITIYTGEQLIELDASDCGMVIQQAGYELNWPVVDNSTGTELVLRDTSTSSIFSFVADSADTTVRVYELPDTMGLTGQVYYAKLRPQFGPATGEFNDSCLITFDVLQEYAESISAIPFCALDSSFSNDSIHPAGPDPLNWSTTAQRPQWYHFVPTNDYVGVQVLIGDSLGSLTEARIALFVEDSATHILQEVESFAKHDTSQSRIFEELTPNRDHYLVIDEPNGGQGSFSMCMDDAQPGDRPVDAVMMKHDRNDCTDSLFYATSGNNAYFKTGMNGAGGYDPNTADFWFEFQAVDGDLTLSLTGDGSGFDGGFTLRNKENLSIVMDSSNAAIDTLSTSIDGLIAGNYYYVQVYHSLASAQNFTLCIGGGGLKMSFVVTHTTCKADTASITSNPLSGTGPYHFIWEDGSQASSISDLAPGVYQVTVVESNNLRLDTTLTVEAMARWRNQVELADSSGYIVTTGGSPTGMSTYNSLAAGYNTGYVRFEVTDSIQVDDEIYLGLGHGDDYDILSNMEYAFGTTNGQIGIYLDGVLDTGSFDVSIGQELSIHKSSEEVHFYIDDTLYLVHTIDQSEELRGDLTIVALSDTVIPFGHVRFGHCHELTIPTFTLNTDQMGESGDYTVSGSCTGNLNGTSGEQLSMEVDTDWKDDNNCTLQVDFAEAEDGMQYRYQLEITDSGWVAEKLIRDLTNTDTLYAVDELISQSGATINISLYSGAEPVMKTKQVQNFMALLGPGRSITPNDDDNYDELEFSGVTISDEFKVEVYDQADRLIFTSTDINSSWEGTDTITGQPAPSGAYLYKASLNDEFIEGRFILKQEVQ